MSTTSELPLALSITFAPSTSTISLTLFDQPSASVKPIPLQLKFKYDPSTPYAPIQEIVDDRNQRIKQVSLVQKELLCSWFDAVEIKWGRRCERSCQNGVWCLNRASHSSHKCTVV